MPTLDIVIGYAMLLAVGLAGTFVIRSKSHNLRGLRELRWAFVAGVVALSFMALERVLPAVVVADGFLTGLLLGFAFAHLALARALKRPSRLFPFLLFLLPLYLFGITYFSIFQNSLSDRLEVSAIGIAIMLAWTAQLAAEPTSPGLTVPVRWVFRLLIVLIILRVAHAIITADFDPIQNLEILDPLQSLMIHIQVLGALALGAGIFWISICAQQEADRNRADTDGLTGLLNRRAFEEVLSQHLSVRPSDTAEISLLLIDLDFFKTMNDEFGHLAGDTVLRRVGGVLRRSVRSVDALARFGGDEFAVLLCSDVAGQGMLIAQRIQENLVQMKNLPGGKRVTASLGVATALPGDSPMLLFERADRALYRSKEMGRNRLTHFDDNDSEETGQSVSSVLIQ